MGIEGLFGQEYSIFYHHPLHILINLADLCSSLSIRFVHLMLNVQRRVRIGFKNPRSQFVIYQNVKTDYLETLPICFRKLCMVVILHEGIQPYHELPGYFVYPLSQTLDINPFLLHLLPQYFEALLAPFSKSTLTDNKFLMVLVKGIVGQVDVRVVEILLGGHLVLLCTESC